MTNTELNLVTDHLGHSLNIHTSVYKLQQNILERTKVARILLSADQGLLNRLDTNTDTDFINNEDIDICSG